MNGIAEPGKPHSPFLNTALSPHSFPITVIPALLLCSHMCLSDGDFVRFIFIYRTLLDLKHVQQSYDILTVASSFEPIFSSEYHKNKVI